MIAPSMRDNGFLCSIVGSLSAISLLLLSACENKAQVPADHPRLASNVVMKDVTFRSASLNREMQYRVLFPATVSVGTKLPVVYLLHGGGGGFRDWSNYSDVARFAERLILVMPEGDESYYTNSVSRPQDRYEDYIVNDLIAEVEGRFPVSSDRANRAIIGVSMGGFGAVKLALTHPQLFAFAGGLSSAVDVPSRPFSIKRISQWSHHKSIFGPWKSEARSNNDPFVLARSADPSKIPYLFLTCGQQEGLLPSNRQFAGLLEARHFNYEFHAVPGGHNWSQWNEQLSECFRSLMGHIGLKAER
jgi:S-formylglutathione hydrolase FrmB